MMIPSVVESFYKSLQSLIACLIRHGKVVINLIVIFTFLVVVVQFWYSHSECKLVLFVGSPGSSTSELGMSIADRIRSTASSGGTTYDIAVEATPENISIRERMAAENNRYALGLIEDGNGFESGKEKGNSIRALLPLEWDYLYILCSKPLFERVRATGTTATTLGDVIDSVGPGMLYMGPEKSSTNRMATLALEKYDGVSIAKIAKGIADWREMRSALKRQELELVFAKGPLGSTLLQQVANDDSAVLIGLGDVTDAIQREEGFQVYGAELPPNLYGAKPSLIAQDYSAVFCRPGIKTLASRRVLACPKSLSTADAYLLATVAKRACEEDEYRINLMAQDLPNGGGQTLVSELRMPIHAGLKFLRENQTPFVIRDWSTWPTWLTSLLSVAIGLIALDVLNLLTRYLTRAAEGGSKVRDAHARGTTSELSSKMDYRQLSGLLKSYSDTLRSQSHNVTAAHLQEWDAKLRGIRTAIKGATLLSPSQREDLLEGVGELRWDAMSSQWVARNDYRSDVGDAHEAVATAMPLSPQTPKEPADIE